MVDPLYLFARALNLFGAWLDKVSPIPWPLAIAALLPLYAMSLSIFVWYMRGMFWPLTCGYPTVRKSWCRRLTAGEWHRCWYHGSWRFRKTDKHHIQPKLRRWETLDKNGKPVEREDVWGIGFLQLRPRCAMTPLYYKGFAKRTGDVLRYVPDLLNRIKVRLHERRQDFRQLRKEKAQGSAELGSPATPGESILSEKLPTVVKSTQVTLLFAMLGLTLVILAVFLDMGTKQPINYASALAFCAAGAFALEGIWRAERHWVSLAVVNTAKWYGPFLIIAIVGGFIDMGGRALGID